ncbi:hypothetical protein FRC01_010090 [Tulasnella sp. 417]|nr:hypothetical protein FRC01_010090 [Tulasnella sp. 417]
MDDTHHQAREKTMQWARTTVHPSSLVFILLLLFLSPVQIFLQIWARQSTAEAFNFLYAIDDISDLPLAFEVLVPGGSLLSCFEIPPAGTSFESYCDTVWNNVLAVNQSASFQAVETTVASAKASTVFDDYVALARPTGPPSILAGKGRDKQRNGNGKSQSGFPGDQDRQRSGDNRFRFKGSKGKTGKQSGTGQGDNQASVTPSATQTSRTNQGMLLSSGIVSLPVGYLPEPNDGTVTAAPSSPTDTDSAAFITVVLTGDSVVNVPTTQLTASALPIATGGSSAPQTSSATPATSRSTSTDESTSTNGATSTEGSPRTNAVTVPTAGNRPQTQGKGGFRFGQNGRKSPVASPTSVSRPLNNLNGNKKGGSDGTRFGQSSGNNRFGKGKNQAKPTTTTSRPRPKFTARPFFPGLKKGSLNGFKSFGKSGLFGKRQAQNQTFGELSLNADEDQDGDGADGADDGDEDDDDDEDYTYFNATFVVPFNGKNIILQPQYDQASTNKSSTRRPRFIGMALTGLRSAPFGTSDVTFIAVPCIRGLTWAEQTLGHTLKESAVAMGLWAWIGVMGILAVMTQSVSLLITAFVGLLISVLFSVFQLVGGQFFEREYQRAVVNGVCGGVDVIDAYPSLRLELQFGMIGMALISIVLSGACVRFLLPIFGAEMRAKLEGLPALNRPYRLMIALKVLFELLSFIIPATSALWLDAVFSSLPAAFSEYNELEEALLACFAGFVVPWLMLGYEATRRSLCRTMIIFLVLTFPILAGWSTFFAIDIYRVWLATWQFLAVLPVIAITLTTVILVLGTIYRLDFKRGLPQLMGHCLPQDPSAVITTPPRDLEQAVPVREEKVSEGALPLKVQFDIPSPASAKSVEVAEQPSANEKAERNEIWTPRRPERSSRWTVGRWKGLFRTSGSTMTRDGPRPSQASSILGPGPPPSVLSYSGSGTAPPSSYLASVRHQPASPHYTDSSVDLSERGPKQGPRRPGQLNAPPRPARPARLKLRDSVWTEESSKESDGEVAPAAKQIFRRGVGPSGGLRVAGRFALGLK